MKHDIDAIVDDLLGRWHRWRSGYSHARGYSGTSATFRDAPPSWSRYGRDDDADDANEESIMRGVDAAVARVPNDPQPWRLCLEFEARNLTSRAAVWSSERLPAGEELAVLKIEARNRLLRELHRDGLVGV